MSSQGGLLSVCSKNVVKFCVILSNTCILVVCKDGVHMCLLCVYVVLTGEFYLIKSPKNKWSNCLLRVREDSKFVENTQNGWLCETLES